MTLQELSAQYARSAELLKGRIVQLRVVRGRTRDREACRALDARLRELEVLWRESRDLAILTGRYYEKGYRRNTKYVL